MTIEALGSSAFLAAVLFGFRHGFDWDHLAALSDLTGSQPSSRRSMALATLYALGHACMIVALGMVAILFAEQVPQAADLAMERLVGVSLVALGLWIAWTAVRTRSAPPLRSRWMLLIDAVRRESSRWRRTGEVVVIEHSHPHDHDHPMHDHSHVDLAGAEGSTGARTTPVAIAHSHAHHHIAVPPLDPFVRYGSWSSFGVGVLHGIGAETPTQVLVFAAAAHATGRPTSIGLLLCFVVGLVAANTLVAAGTTLGYRSVLRNRWVAGGLAVVTAVFSLVVGSLLLFGQAGALPTIPGT